MNLVDVALLLPGACFVTGRSDGPFIDTGYDVDDLANVGRVYLAESFIADCSALIGGLGPDAAQILRDQLAAAKERVATLEEAVEGLAGANEALFRAGYRLDPEETPDEPEAAVEEEPEPTMTAAELAVAALSDLSDDDLLQTALDRGLGDALEAGQFEDRQQIIDALAAQVTAA